MGSSALELVQGIVGDEMTAWVHPLRPTEITDGGQDDTHDTFHRTFDPQTESVAEVVVTAASVIHNAEPTDLESLNKTVDVDALEAMFGHVDETANLVATFVYEDLEITVSGDGNVWLRWD